MPGSMPEQKDFIREFLVTHGPIRRILDIGPGAGSYYDLLHDLGAEMIGIEIWGPYIETWNLRGKYDLIIIADINYVDWTVLGNFDVVILGDVLEHMVESKGREIVRKAAEHSNWVVISLPIVYYPQGAEYGNVHETHVEQYSSERMREFLSGYEIIDFREGEFIGAYIFRKSQ